MPNLDDLPPQQRRVALLIAKGLPYKTIAAQLAEPNRPYSVRTVEWHALDIVRRLNEDPATNTEEARELQPQQRIIVWVIAEQYTAEHRKAA